jgi:hypothetical protein
MSRGGDSSSVDRVGHLFAQQNLHNIPVERMNRIPAEERTKALNDLHGVSHSENEETPDLIERCLDELDLELLLVEPRDAYEEAMKQNPEYVKGLRLAFLRADDFQASKAAFRMARHFETKCVLFGRPRLGRELTLEDLSPGARSELRKGLVQLLPQKDRGGRAIFLHYHERSDGPLEDVNRWLELYFFWSNLAANEVEVQKNGFVLINYGVGYKFGGDNAYRGGCILTLCGATLVRCVACHVCFDYNPMKVWLSEMFGSLAGSKFLIRLQSHFGTHVECFYSLMTFGIPTKILPLDMDGSIDLRPLHEWIREHEQTTPRTSSDASGVTPHTPLVVIEGEESSSTPLSSSGFTPQPMDVVMGRGRRGDGVAGNQKLRGLWVEYLPLYDSASSVEKTAFAQIVYEKITASGARFLAPPSKKNPEWSELTESESNTRILDGFRNLRKKKMRNASKR